MRHLNLNIEKTIAEKDTKIFELLQFPSNYIIIDTSQVILKEMEETLAATLSKRHDDFESFKEHLPIISPLVDPETSEPNIRPNEEPKSSL